MSHGQEFCIGGYISYIGITRAARPDIWSFDHVPCPTPSFGGYCTFPSPSTRQQCRRGPELSTDGAAVLHETRCSMHPRRAKYKRTHSWLRALWGLSGVGPWKSSKLGSMPQSRKLYSAARVGPRQCNIEKNIEQTRAHLFVCCDWAGFDGAGNPGHAEV